MKICSAKNCSYNSRQGFRLYSFPKDPELRQLWISKMCKSYFIPTESSALCERHFTADQWEDVRLKILKSTAVPTIFRRVVRRKKTAIGNKRYKKLRIEDFVKEKEICPECVVAREIIAEKDKTIASLEVELKIERSREICRGCDVSKEIIAEKDRTIANLKEELVAARSVIEARKNIEFSVKVGDMYYFHSSSANTI